MAKTLKVDILFFSLPHESERAFLTLAIKIYLTEETRFMINHKEHHSFAIQCSIGNQEKNYYQELDFPQQRC